MKSNYKIASAVIASIVLGVGTSHIPHAQAKPSAYGVAMIDARDEDGLTKGPLNQPIIKEFGGKSIGGGYNKPTGIRGTLMPDRVELVQYYGGNRSYSRYGYGRRGR
jgi:hypothetical protein